MPLPIFPSVYKNVKIPSKAHVFISVVKKFYYKYKLDVLYIILSKKLRIKYEIDINSNYEIYNSIYINKINKIEFNGLFLNVKALDSYII